MPNTPLFPALQKVGLNLQAAFNLCDLPEPLRTKLLGASQSDQAFKQVILIGHGGKDLWQALQAQPSNAIDPIDEFSRQQISTCLQEAIGKRAFEFLYPGDHLLGLQELGVYAGWHNPSLLRIGIMEKWGTWFAYRAVVLADTNLATSKPIPASSLCQTCTSKACVEACPASAVGTESFAANDCFSWRAEDKSPCAKTCLARRACPVAKEHTYSEDQQAYHYGLSLKAIKRANLA